MENVKAGPFFKSRLATSGPTPVPTFVLAAMSNEILYHRSPDFAAVMQDCRNLLPALFETKQEALIFSGSGTLAMEGAISNFFNPGDEVVAVDAGKFGQRWVSQAKVYGLKVHEIKVARGRAVDVSEVKKAVQANPNVRGILAHASETSTGVRHDIKSIAEIARNQKDCFMCVDAVTGAGVFNVHMDKWGLDVVVGGSQKGFMLPPGLSFGVASERAWKRCEETKNVRYYMDWRKERKAAGENSGAFTSPVSLIVGLREVLKYFHALTPDELYKRHWKLAFGTRAAMKAMGFELFVKDDNEFSPVVTSVIAEGPYTKKMRETYGLTVSGGQDELKGKIVRLGHVGYMDAWDVLNQIVAMGQVGKELGVNAKIGAGVDAFWDVLSQNKDFTPENMK